MNSGLKFIYTLFLGILVATFVGLGIAAFYPAPNPPRSSEEKLAPEVNPPAPVESPEEKQAWEESEKEQQEYQKVLSLYVRNVFIIALIAAVIILVISLTIARNISVIADGLLLGGTLTLFYGIVMGFNTNDNKFRFLAVSVGLFVTLIVGYLKFIKGQTEVKTTK